MNVGSQLRGASPRVSRVNSRLGPASELASACCFSRRCRAAASAATSGGAPLSSSNSPERLIEIGDQVFHVLDPDGEPYETVAQPHLVAQRLRYARVRHRGRVPDQALHAAQRLREREDPGALDEAPRPFQGPELQADHAAEPL